MTTIRTELPIATEPWERARSLFIEQLSPHERTLFEKADLDTIYHDASVSHRKHQQSSKLQAARRRLAPLVDAIDGYGKGLDVMSNTPVAAALLCPIWGGIRVALYVAQETEKYFEKLAKMLEKIGRTLPLFRDYQHLFPSHERLLQVLSEAYLNVLRFCTDVTALFKDAKTRTVSIVSLTVSCRTLWKPFTLRFAEYLKNFKDLKQQVQDEANVAHMIESKRERELQERSRALAETRLREEKLRQTLQNLSPIDYHQKHRRLRSVCHRGTTQWIFGHHSYKSWKESTNSSSIHCNGIPGSGKTTLASSVINKLITDPGDPSQLVCFYYCDYADHETLDPAVILGTFIRQIIEGSHHADELSEWVLNQWGNLTSKPLAQELLPAVLDAFNRFDHVTIVIDALDELSPLDQHECGKMISAFLGLRACQVKVFLSCRFEAIVLNRLPPPQFSIALSPELLSKDICLFVEDIVQEKVDNKDLIIEDPALKQEINDRLKEGAQDMFLWVKFQIAELCECMSDTELRSTVENLPRDLAGTYRRILYKIACSTRGKEKLKIARRAFRWIVCAKRPLTIQELSEAVVLKDGEQSFPTNRIPTDGGRQIRLACGNLIVYDEEHRLVRLAHHTVQQFLTDFSEDDAFTYEASVHSSMSFTLDEAEPQIYTLCLTYLCFSDFETQITLRDRNTAKISDNGGFVPSLINHMLPESGMVGRLTTLLNGRSCSTNNVNRWNLKVQGKSRRVERENELKEKFSLLGYVSSWWCFHSPSRKHFTPSARSELIRRTQEVALEKNFDFDHRPWEKDDFGVHFRAVPPEGMLIFLWAARTGKFAFWEILSQSIMTSTTDSIRERYFRHAMLQDSEERNLLGDILHGGSEAMLESYFEVVQVQPIGTAIPAWVICRALRMSPSSRHAALFAEMRKQGFEITRGLPLEKPSFWRNESTSTFWCDNEWSFDQKSGFHAKAGSYLLEEAIKQDDIDLVQCILANDVGKVVLFGSEHMNTDESPLARATYQENTAMVEVLFSYINLTAPSVGAHIEIFSLGDLCEALMKQDLWDMVRLVRRMGGLNIRDSLSLHNFRSSPSPSSSIA